MANSDPFPICSICVGCGLDPSHTSPPWILTCEMWALTIPILQTGELRPRVVKQVAQVNSAAKDSDQVSLIPEPEVVTITLYCLQGPIRSPPRIARWGWGVLHHTQVFCVAVLSLTLFLFKYQQN